MLSKSRTSRACSAYVPPPGEWRCDCGLTGDSTDQILPFHRQAMRLQADLYARKKTPPETAHSPLVAEREAPGPTTFGIKPSGFLDQRRSTALIHCISLGLVATDSSSAQFLDSPQQEIPQPRYREGREHPEGQQPKAVVDHLALLLLDIGLNASRRKIELRYIGQRQRITGRFKVLGLDRPVAPWFRHDLPANRTRERVFGGPPMGTRAYISVPGGAFFPSHRQRSSRLARRWAASE